MTFMAYTTKIMTKLRIGLIIAGIIMIIISLILLDYSDLSWSVNSGIYGVMMTAIIGIVAMVYSIKHDDKKP